MIKKVSDNPIKYECYLIDFSKTYMISDWTEFKTFSERLTHFVDNYFWAPEVNKLRFNLKEIEQFKRLDKNGRIWRLWADKAMVYQIAKAFEYYNDVFNYNEVINSMIPNMLATNPRDRPSLKDVIHKLDPDNSKDYSFSL